MHRLVLVSALALVACSKSDPPAPQSTTPASSAAAPAGSAPAAAPSAASSAATGAAAPASAGAFAGKYETKASTLYLPDTKEMQRVKWRGDESSEGLGAGDLSLTIEPDGSVHGEATGALGAMRVVGQAEGDSLAASLQRKTPNEPGFTGTLHAVKKDGALVGEMNVTSHDASVLRTGTFQLAAQ